MRQVAGVVLRRASFKEKSTGGAEGLAVYEVKEGTNPSQTQWGGMATPAQQEEGDFWGGLVS